jgi:hypothetical protein
MIYDLDNENDRDRFKVKSNALFKNKKKVELKVVQQKKTVSQNGYIHVLFDLYAVENGYTSKESKELVKDNCPFLKYWKNNEEFTKGMSDLDKEETSKFIDWFLDWAGQQGCLLPEAGKYEKDFQHFDNSINNHKQYL